MKKSNIQYIAITILFLGTVAYGAWSDPTIAPAGGGVALPITSLPVAQTKDGGLSVRSIAALGTSQLSQQSFFAGALFGSTGGVLTFDGDVTTTGDLALSGSAKVQSDTLTGAAGSKPICAKNTGELTICSVGAVCGNNNIETGEQCDDGNTTSGDGCSNMCQSEILTPGRVLVYVRSAPIPTPFPTNSTNIAPGDQQCSTPTYYYTVGTAYVDSSYLSKINTPYQTLSIQGAKLYTSGKSNVTTTYIPKRDTGSGPTNTNVSNDTGFYIEISKTQPTTMTSAGSGTGNKVLMYGYDPYQSIGTLAPGTAGSVGLNVGSCQN